MGFTSEAAFEKELIRLLRANGWQSENDNLGFDSVLKYPSEQDLIDNWAKILYVHNNTNDRLNDCPLTRSEMEQILEKIDILKSPYNINGLINGESVSIKRDNENDTLHYQKEISLSIFNRRAIGGSSVIYQIVEQPIFKRKNKRLNDRRGDLMLLIDGMPLFHVELKSSNVNISEATHQIEKYSHEGLFTGIFGLIQIFVAMTPEETVYFANPGQGNPFNPKFYFHWEDFNNEIINSYDKIARSLLSIPTAHQLIGLYTIADAGDGVLKVLRSYQCHAVNKIVDVIAKNKWDEGNQRGGYIWHTTGSGKTMTSFKVAQLVAASNNADKVVFLTDRIELGKQSYDEYSNFALDKENVVSTDNTYALIAKLKSKSIDDTLIVTSIHKMSRVIEDEYGNNTADIEIINQKRIVFIVDEAHRSTFGDMLYNIKTTFPNGLFFGFTGTPIYDENAKKDSTTSAVFGNELARYPIADGIRDENVLPFDPYMVCTYKPNDLRKAVALEYVKANSEEEALADPNKRNHYLEFLDNKKYPMAGYKDSSGKYHKGIEDYVPNAQYNNDNHRKAVVRDIVENWNTISGGNVYHAIFATSSIPEAIEYYRLLKKEMPAYVNVAALFDPTIDNTGGVTFKESAMIELFDDYESLFHISFSIPTFGKYKEDVQHRLAHKEAYKFIGSEPDKQLHLLIVVDQLLTGYDSKWVNALYLDKMLQYENVIQSLSRTNRVLNNEKQCGVIRYYRRPYTMKRNIEQAVALYAGDKPVDLFVDKLVSNIHKINHSFVEIKDLFKQEGLNDFSTLPQDKHVVSKFSSLFVKLNRQVDAAKIQGLDWSKSEYTVTDDYGDSEECTLELSKENYMSLLQRYKEIPQMINNDSCDDIPFDIANYILAIDTQRIDDEYINSRFQKFIKSLDCGASEQEVTELLANLHTAFAMLSKENQKVAELIIHDIESGDFNIVEGKTFKEYINDYKEHLSNDRIHQFSTNFGVDEQQLRDIMALKPNEGNLNEFGRFDNLKYSVNKDTAKQYLEAKEGCVYRVSRVNREVDATLKKFIFSNGENE